MTLTQIRALVLLLVYFVVRFVFSEQLDSLGMWSSYYFEAVYVGLVAWLYWSRLSFRVPFSFRLATQFVFSVMAGLVIYKLAAPLGLIVPFDMRSTETLILLLLVGPILEEMIFRMAMWELLSEFLKEKGQLILATSVIFAFAHFFAWWFVPNELRSYVLYQAIYAFFLGSYLAFFKSREKSVGVPIVLHFFFNLGYFIGFAI
ncbi:CPBP family intramembrane metalloprotease [bacterium]|jgi:membrane protease YdiL (CAAX protease family)|nr:CPBP family intramembrane metalloprotease [bacterium]